MSVETGFALRAPRLPDTQLEVPGSAVIAECVTRPPCDRCHVEVDAVEKSSGFRTGDRATCPLCLGLIKSEVPAGTLARFANTVILKSLAVTEKNTTKYEVNRLASILDTPETVVRQVAFRKTQWTLKTARAWLTLNGFVEKVHRGTDTHWLFSMVPGSRFHPEQTQMVRFTSKSVAGMTITVGALLQGQEASANTDQFGNDEVPVVNKGFRDFLMKPDLRAVKPDEVQDEPEPSVEKEADDVPDELVKVAEGLGIDVTGLTVTQISEKIAEAVSALKSKADLGKVTPDMGIIEFSKTKGIAAGRVESHGHAHSVGPMTIVGKTAVMAVSGTGRGHVHTVRIDLSLGTVEMSVETDPVSGKPHTHDVKLREVSG